MSIDSEPKQLHDSSHPCAKELDELYADALKAHKYYIKAEDMYSRVGMWVDFVYGVSNMAGEKYTEYKKAYEKWSKEEKEKICGKIIKAIEDVKVPENYKHLHDSSHP